MNAWLQYKYKVWMPDYSISTMFECLTTVIYLMHFLIVTSPNVLKRSLQNSEWYYIHVLPWSNVALNVCPTAVTEYTNAVNITTVKNTVSIMTSCVAVEPITNCKVWGWNTYTQLIRCVFKTYAFQHATYRIYSLFKPYIIEICLRKDYVTNNFMPPQ